MKLTTTWHSERVGSEVRLARWGHWGTPVLVFPTAGGDAEEIERFQMIAALAPLIDAGKIKVYSCDSLAGRAWLSGRHSPEHCAWLQDRYDALVYHEVIAAIRLDCRSPDIEVITAGASIGAFNAVATLCRHPDAVRLAIGLSGTFDLERFMYGRSNHTLYFSSPLHYLPRLDGGAQLEGLRRRFVLLAFGEGRWEDPRESWRLAEVLGAKGIPNRVDAWGRDYDHDWPTWRAMLPKYLAELG